MNRRLSVNRPSLDMLKEKVGDEHSNPVLVLLDKFFFFR